MTSPFITVPELAVLLDSPAGPVVLDSSCVLHPAKFDGDYRRDSGRPCWLEAHIPGSQHVDVPSQFSDDAATLHYSHPTSQAIADELARIGHTLQPLDIVVVNTSAGAKYGQPDYVPSGCGMGREATLYLTSRGVRMCGTDAWSWDAPFGFTAKRYAETKDARIIWEGHKAGRDIGYCQIEKLSNLEQLPATGFMVSCFPVKISKASGGWTRAVAIIED